MRRPLRALVLLALLALVACGSPAAATVAITPPTPTPTPAPIPSSSAAAQPAMSGAPVTPTRTPTARAAASSRQCAYRMTGPLRNQEVTATVQAALVAGGFSNVTAQANDSGENYACSDNTAGFGVMNRDFVITLPVADLADREALGVQLQRLLTIAQEHATAPSNRYLVSFTTSGGQERVEANGNAWQQASTQGLTGAALLNALQSSAR